MEAEGVTGGFPYGVTRRRQHKPAAVEYKCKRFWGPKGWHIWKRYRDEKTAREAARVLQRNWGWMKYEFRIKGEEQ